MLTDHEIEKAKKVLELTIQEFCEHESQEPYWDDNIYEGSIEWVLEAIIQGFRNGGMEVLKYLDEETKKGIYLKLINEDHAN